MREGSRRSFLGISSAAESTAFKRSAGNMHILHFPPEVLDLIIHLSILDRTLPRALRLKLVCQSFRASVQRTIFHTSLLDDYNWDGPLRGNTAGGIRKDHGAAQLWHDYLVFRCRQVKKPKHPDEEKRPIPRFDEIRSVAETIVQYQQEYDQRWRRRRLERKRERRRQEQAPERREGQELDEEQERQTQAQEQAREQARAQARAQADMEQVLDKLCWLAIDPCQSGYEFYTGWAVHRREQPNLGLSTLSAATYLGHSALAQKLLRGGQRLDPTADDGLFPSPMYIATRTGRGGMLVDFQHHLLQFEHDTPQFPMHNWLFKTGPGSLQGACVRGDMLMVNISLCPVPRVIPESTEDEDKDEKRTEEEREKLILGHQPGSILRESLAENYIWNSMVLSHSPQVYDYLHGLLAPPTTSPAYHSALRNLEIMATAGNLTMVRHQLDNGANPTLHSEIYLGEALARAVRANNVEIVDLLLERGVDPQAYDDRGRTILTMAAKAGSLHMMKKLLRAGARVHEPTSRSQGDFYTLSQAVRSEHGKMVELLLDLGAGTEHGRAHILRLADARGLESMVQLLQSRGITHGEGGSL